MGRLTSADRRHLKRSQFAGPGRSYPVPDKAHARIAKTDASRAVNDGRMSKSEEKRIDRQANRVLGRGSRRAKR